MSKYVFFDFNGTIINDVDLCFDLLNRMLKEKGKSTISLDEYKNIFMFPIIEYYKKAGFEFPKDDFSLLAKEFVKGYTANSNNCSLMHGVEDIFKYLKNKGYTLVCLSASEVNMLNKQLKFYKLDTYFEAILGIDDFHAGSKVDIAKNFLNSNHIDHDKAYMIGDTLHDLEVSEEMGINCILYANGHQSYERLIKSGKPVVRSYKELKTFF